MAVFKAFVWNVSDRPAQIVTVILCYAIAGFAVWWQGGINSIDELVLAGGPVSALALVLHRQLKQYFTSDLDTG